MNRSVAKTVSYSRRVCDSDAVNAVFVVQSVCGNHTGKRSVNDSLMELLLLVSTMRRHNAAKITAVLPYYAYARQVREEPLTRPEVRHRTGRCGHVYPFQRRM